MGLTNMGVEIKMPIYEIDGKETLGLGDAKLAVKSHWNRTSDLVVICVGGKEYTVAVDAISKAVTRATF